MRTVPLRVGPWDAAFDREGRILVASSSSERPFPLLLLDHGGQLLREFAGDSASRLIHSPRGIAAAPDGSWWTLPMQFHYRLEHWDSTGVLLGVIERRPDWYPPYTESIGPTREHAPSPMLMNAWFDAAGRLWVLGKVADAHWVAGLSAPVGGDSLTTASISDADKVYDTVIEVLDPATGALLAQTRFDVSYPFAVEPGVIMRVLVTRNGWNRAELMRVIFDLSRVKEVPK